MSTVPKEMPAATARRKAMAAAGVLLLAGLAAPVVYGQAWRPDKTVEFVIPTGPGANNDRMVRLIQRVLQEQKLVATPVVALNKPGGNQHLSVVYLGQKGVDPHTVLLSNPTLFTNELQGISPQHHSVLTPLALLVVESNVFTVHANSPMKGMRDLMDRIRANPDSVAFAMPSRGGVTHLAAGAAAKAAGLDARKLKVVVFKASGESMTALVGGHVDVMVSSLASVMPHVKAGTLRVLGIAAQQRRGGTGANVPTLREQGIATDGVAAWRGLHGAKGLAPAHVAFWEENFAKVTDSAEWKNFLAENDLGSQFMRGRDFAKFLEGEYAVTKALMADVGITKSP